MTKKPSKILLFFLLGANCVQLLAQTDTVYHKSNIEVTRELIEDYSNERKGLKILDEAHYINYLHANNINDSAMVLFALGKANFLKNNYLKAARYFLVANEYLKRNRNDLLNAEIVFETANSYQRLFFLKKAIEYYKTALTRYGNFLQTAQKNRIIMDIGNSFLDLNQQDSAWYYYNLALKNAKNENDQQNETIALINIGNLRNIQGNYALADSLTKKALILSKIHYLAHLEIVCKFNLAEIRFNTGDFEASADFFNQVLNEAEKAAVERLIPDVYKYFVLLAYERKNFKKAIEFSEKFIQASEKYLVREKKIGAIKQINKILIEIELVAGAKEVHGKNTQLLDSILLEEIKEKQQLMESLQQLTELQEEYKDLVIDNKLKEEKITRIQIVIGLVTIILLLIVVTIVFTIRSRNKIKRQNRTIQKQFQYIKRESREMEKLNHEVKMQSEEIKVQNDQLLANKLELEEKIKRRTAALEIALKKAEESDSLKTSFLQNLSHEIRTPLNAINGFAQLISKDKNVQSDYSEIITQNVYDLIDIIDNIVLFSTLQANQYQLTVSATPVKSIVTQLKADFSLIKNKYKRKTIDFSFNNQLDEKRTMRTDVALLQKVLIQLVENAFKFTEQGSVELIIDEQGEHIRFSIKDTGMGIKKEKQPYIFDTFRKLESEKIFRGTGIGLALVKKIITLLNGEISLTSEFGKGTTVFINLPDISA